MKLHIRSSNIENFSVELQKYCFVVLENISQEFYLVIKLFNVFASKRDRKRRNEIYLLSTSYSPVCILCKFAICLVISHPFSLLTAATAAETSSNLILKKDRSRVVQANSRR